MSSISGSEYKTVVFFNAIGRMHFLANNHGELVNQT